MKITLTLSTFRGIAVLAAALVVAASVTAGAGADSSVDEHPGLIKTVESNCFETNDRRPVPLADADAYVPDRYRVRPFGTPLVPLASVGFIDYACDSLSVNGHQPRPTIVSLGTVLVTRDDVNATYILWVGTDNPLLFARLRQLGVEAHFIPRSSVHETTNTLGQRVITVDHVGAGPSGLNYTRKITVLTEPGGTATESVGTMYHLGSEGEVGFQWLNTVLPPGAATVCLDIEPGSVPDQYGITNFPPPNPCFPSPRPFFRGSWTGTIAPVE